MNVGRNDPCPCGSGKKYKKCCLEKEQELERQQLLKNVDEWEQEEEVVKEDEALDSEEKQTEVLSDEDFEEDEDPELEETVGDFIDIILKNENDEPVTNNIPDLSEDEKLVDDWWDEYIEMKDTEKEREHLIQFIDKYPHLVEKLELHYEVLFELGDNHFDKGIYDTFVTLLLRIRSEFPQVYIKSYGYYDADLIYWYAAQGRIDEISPFFDFFKQKTTREFYDNLDNIIHFLNAINRSDILFAELATHPTTNKVIISERINRIVSHYLDQPVTEETVHLLIKELEADGIYKDQSGDFNYLFNRLRNVNRPFTVWDEKIPKKRSQAMDYYMEITDNFSIFLHKNIGLSFISSEYYANSVYGFYRKMVSEKQLPKSVFCLDRTTFDKKFSIRDWLWLDDHVEYLSMINAFYYFADYLKACGNLMEEQKHDFQAYLTETFRDFYCKYENSGPEMLSFKQFPLWGDILL